MINKTRNNHHSKCGYTIVDLQPQIKWNQSHKLTPMNSNYDGHIWGTGYFEYNMIHK